MNLPPLPDLTVTMTQEFEIAKIMKQCEGESEEVLLAVIGAQLHQMACLKNTITKLIREWPNGQSES